MKIGIATKINFLFFLGMLLSSFAVGILAYFQYFENIQENVRFRLHSGLEIASVMFPIEDVLNYQLDSPEKNPKYALYWERLNTINEVLQLRYVYVLKVDETGKLLFLFDTGDDPYVVQRTDEKGNVWFEFTEFATEERKKKPAIQDQYGDGGDVYFTFYDDAPKEIYLAIQNVVVVSTEAYADKWGNFISMFKPIVLNGKVVAVIGTDLDVSYIQELKRSAIFIFCLILSLGVIVMFIVRRMIQYSIIAPILKLSEGSTQIAAGDWNFHLSVNSEDEIGILADNFRTMSTRLKGSFEKIKNYSEQLEDMVRIRTEQLEKSLQEMQKLKDMQDGDYFLTTLIANPLMQNRNNLHQTKIEFKVVQKKQFFFRGREHQLGGDLCISGNILIEEEMYTLVMNGDAMGKSMQGAGGALVVGSLLNSIISRQSSLNKLRKINPEKWLVQTFWEMQSVMEAFDGSMLVSLIIGLVNIKTGDFYYINAEHPFPILFRDEKASFLHTTNSAYKIGFPENEIRQLFQTKLLAGDVLLLSSDGRDDIEITLENGKTIINENRNLILEVVKECAAEPTKIIKKLSTIGTLTDDISFLKLTFQPNA